MLKQDLLRQIHKTCTHMDRVFQIKNITNPQTIIKPATAHTAATHTQPPPTDPRTLNSSIMNAGDHAHTTAAAMLPTSNSGEQNNIYSVMEKQNEITALLIHQTCLFSMPKREIQVFDGDPLQYQTFIKSFEHSIECKNENYKDCLYYLEQYTNGQPREIVRSCLHMDSDRIQEGQVFTSGAIWQ